MAGDKSGKEEWRVLARQRQFEFSNTLGSREYDEIEKTNLFLLKKKVGFAICGKPSELPSCGNYSTGYNKDEIEHIKSICNKIIEKSNDDCYVRLAFTILILYHKNDIAETCVLRIVSSSGNVFIDANGRVYKDWEQFIEKNKLPDCEYCYPPNGEYPLPKNTSENKEDFKVGFAHSPASTLVSKTVDCLDTAGSVASLAAAGVFAGSLVVAVAPAAVAVAGATAAVTGVYSVTRCVRSLFDRNEHEQSIGLDDREARAAWLNLGSAAVGVTTIAAVGKAQKIVEGGKSLSKVGALGLHTLTASSVVFSGFGFVETFMICMDKYNKGNLTKQDVFDLSCELLFLFNAVASAHATTNLVNNMTAAVAAETPSAQKKLTKTQKRNLRKRAAKRRAKGGLSVQGPPSDETNQTFKISATMKILLFEAVRAFAPRVEDILYKYQSIAHDIRCWNEKEMTDLIFFKNISKTLIQLYNNYKDEITEVIEKLVIYFSSINIDKFFRDIWKLFENSNEEMKNTFCTKIINMEDQIEITINEAEREIIELQESLGIENTDDPSESSVDEDNENFDNDELNPESQQILRTCKDVTAASSWTLKDLDDFGDILDGVKYTIICEFKEKISTYKKSLEAAKSASENSFNIHLFNKGLGIKGDVGQHIFNETLQSSTASNMLYKIKMKCKEIQKKRNAMVTPVWEALSDGMFHYYGPHGAGDLSNPDILSIVSSVIKPEIEISLTEENCKLMDYENVKDVIMIEIKDKPDIKIVVYCGITETNTASGVIVVVK